MSAKSVAMQFLPMLLGIGFFITLQGCGGTGCTPDIRAGISLTVVDAVSGEGAACNATITVFDQTGNTVEERVVGAEYCPAERAINLMDESPGIYQVSIVREGYEDWLSDPIEVKSIPNDCHVRTVPVVAELAMSEYEQPPSVDTAALLAALEAAETTWKLSGYTQYSVEYRGGLAFLGPLASEWKTFTVTDNAITEAYVTSTSMIIDPAEYDDPMIVLLTIDDAFAFIRSLLDDDPYALEVIYDDLYGFPKSILYTSSPFMSEAQQAWEFREFIPID